MTKPSGKKPVGRTVELDPSPKGGLKAIAGSERDEWNSRLANLLAQSMPDHAADKEAAKAGISAMVDMKPTDPVEGILISQIIAANQASLFAYQRGWAQPPEYFDARLKYLNVADKAAKTVAVLTERLDRHRTQGQQQITVKHVTVNADQAVVTDTVVTGGSDGNPLSAAKLVTVEPDNSFRITETAQAEPELVPVGRGKVPK